MAVCFELCEGFGKEMCGLKGGVMKHTVVAKKFGVENCMIVFLIEITFPPFLSLLQSTSKMP